MIFTTEPTDFKPKFEVAVCVTEHNGKILFLQRQVGKGQEYEWGFPGGKLDYGEKAVDAAVRELEEETGIKIQPFQTRFIKKLYYRFPTFDFTVDLFHITLDKEELVTLRDEEHMGYKWVTPHDALQMKYMLDVDFFLKEIYKELSS